MRAAVHAEFLDMLCDVTSPENRLIDSDMNTVLFDFNLLFAVNTDDQGNFIKDPLLEEYMKIRGFMTPALNDVYREEQRAVARRVTAKEDEFYHVTGILGKLAAPNDSYGRTLDRLVAIRFNVRDLTDYFRMKVEEYQRV